MAARPAIIAVESAVWTPTVGNAVTILGLGQGSWEERVTWADNNVRDGNTLPAEDDVAIETANWFALSSDDVDNFVLGLKTGDTGKLEIVATLVGDDTNSKLKISNTKLQIGPLQRAAAPGKKGDRQLFVREFSPLDGGVSATAKAV